MLETHAKTTPETPKTEKETEPETLVIFRKFDEGGDIIALFPEDREGNGVCSSYMRMGQHSGADYGHVIAITSKASPFLYESLRQELVSIGYNLLIRQKWIRRRKTNQ